MDDRALSSQTTNVTQIMEPHSNQSEELLSDSQFQEYIKQYPFAAEPTYFTRPNRYYGPASTWRTWTADDRAIANALDVIRAKDLSSHLYNAFSLKQRHDQTHEREKASGQHASDSQTGAVGNHDHLAGTFMPPEVWTAWPLRGRHVPRDNHQNEISLSTSVPWPSAALEDALMATMTKAAKELWQGRQMQIPSPTLPPTEKRVGEGTQSETNAASSEISDTIFESQPQIDSSNSSSSSDVELPPGIQTFSSQVFAPEDVSLSSEDEMIQNDEKDMPVFSADDEKARHLALPAVRHILTKLDDLLIGLHKSRESYSLRNVAAGSRSRSQALNMDTTEDEGLIRSGSRAASRKRGRKRRRSSSLEDPASASHKHTVSRPRSTNRKYGEKGAGLGLRDWSDVLGFATLTGWNSATISRAGERCAALFEQGMMFRTFHEAQSVAYNRRTEIAAYFEEEFVGNPKTVESDVGSEGNEETPQAISSGEVNHFLRASSPCNRCRVHKFRCQPPQSSDNLDKSTLVVCERCATSEELENPCSGILVKSQLKHDISGLEHGLRICPYPTCSRNNPGKPFAKRDNLDRHIKEVHGHQYTPPISQLASNLDTVEDRASDLVLRLESAISGRVTCPVPNCPQRKHLYARSARLYEHIREKHPTFNLEKHKKAMLVGTKRGKYSRSRSRSKVGEVRQPIGGHPVVETGGDHEHSSSEEDPAEFPEIGMTEESDH